MSGISRKSILVFGATGGTGAAFVDEALAHGHTVTAFVRDPSKLRPHENLILLEGDLFDSEAVKAACATGLDAVFTAYGFSNKTPDNKHERVTRSVVEGMKAAGISRLVAVTSMGAGDSAGIGPIWVRFVARVILRHIIPDKTQQETVIRNSGLDYTILRPPMLVTEPSRDHYTVWQGARPPGKVAWKIARADVAAEALRCIEAAERVGEAVQISW